MGCFRSESPDFLGGVRDLRFFRVNLHFVFRTESPFGRVTLHAKCGLSTVCVCALACLLVCARDVCVVCVCACVCARVRYETRPLNTHRLTVRHARAHTHTPYVRHARTHTHTICTARTCFLRGLPISTNPLRLPCLGSCPSSCPDRSLSPAGPLPRPVSATSRVDPTGRRASCSGCRPALLPPAPSLSSSGDMSVA